MRIQMKVLAMATLAALAAHAQDDDLSWLTKPSSMVSGGVGLISGDSEDRSLYGQYNGLRKKDAYFLFDLDFVRRDDATGTWTIVRARDLGLDTREIGAMIGRQGDWKVYGEYWGLKRWYPRTVNTGMENPTGTDPIIHTLPEQGAGDNVDFNTERRRATVGGQKWLGPNLMVEANFVNEDKDGARLFGRGFTCPSGAAPTPVCTALAAGANQWAILILPEPISSTTRQVDLKATYSGKTFGITGAYYGSFYNNDYSALTPTISGNLNNPLGNPMGQNNSVALTPGLRGILELPMALPPDNQAHQFSLSGNYAFSNTTRANFKAAYTRATQDQDFTQFGGAPAGRTDLGGKLNTTLAQAGVFSRPMPMLSLLANVRFEDRKDKTPIELYNVEGTDAFTNAHIDNRKLNGKLEASYRLPWDLRATVGADYESIDRGEFVETSAVAGLSGLRRKTTEDGYRVELRRAMSDTFSGAISASRSTRDGSTWLKPLSEGVLEASGDCQSATVGGVPNACIYSRTAIFPYMLMDRRRDKVKFLGDWSPMDALSLQLAMEYGRDRYSAPTEKGLKDTDMRLYSLDAVYTLANGWKLTAYYTYSEQSLTVAHSTGYIAFLKDRNSTAGIGFRGTVSPKLRVGGDLLYINDRNVYDQSLDSAASAANVAFLASSGGLPDAVYRDMRIKLYGTYALQKDQEIGVEVVHDRARLDEWTWGYNNVMWAASDNTTVVLNPNQNVTFASVRYTYRFR